MAFYTIALATKAEITTSGSSPLPLNSVSSSEEGFGVVWYWYRCFVSGSGTISYGMKGISNPSFLFMFKRKIQNFEMTMGERGIKIS